MSDQKDKPGSITQEITIEEVNRVLEVGRLLFSVLTEEEITELQEILNRESVERGIGNTGVT
jgi:hypothetical protein